MIKLHEIKRIGLYLIGLLFIWRIQQAVLLNGAGLGLMAVQVGLALRSMLDSLISTATARSRLGVSAGYRCIGFALPPL